MKLKSLLIAVMVLFATAVMAQEQTAYAVLCAGDGTDANPETLYFLAADTEPTGTYKGQKIKDNQGKECVWSGTSVTASPSSSGPAWNTTVQTTLKRVVFEESFKNVKPTSCCYWFYNCENLTEIVGIANLNTSEVTSMERMFGGCSALKELDLSSFDTGKVTYMSRMFHDCSALESLILGNGFTTGEVTNMSDMFRKCSALESLTLGSGFTTGKVKNMSNMFSGCSALKSLDLSSFDTKGVTNMASMFAYCSALESLNLSNFNTELVKNMSSMFYDCNALKSLDLSNFNTGKVMYMTNMFLVCNALKSLDVRKADKAVDMVKSSIGFAKRGMVIYLPADADVSDAVFEENYVIKPEAGTTSFARTFTAGNMSTVCLPFAVDAASVEGGTFYEFKGLNEDKTTVKFGKLASGSTVADRAYLFKPTAGDKVTFTGAAIEALPELAEGSADGLYGVYEKKEFITDEADLNIYYGWSAGNFVSIGAGATVNPGRAYLKLSSLQGSNAKGIMKAVFDDETTGISDVNTTSGDDNAPAYDLMGRRVGDSYRGVVIKNSKKMVR